MPGKNQKTLEWLQSRPSLEDLCEAYPAEWQVVRNNLEGLNGATREQIVEFVRAASHPPASRPGRARSHRMVLAEEIRRQMTVATLRDAHLKAATGVSEGPIRFKLVNGFIAQRLLFAHDLVRKPVRLRLFRTVWPLLGQRRLLMPLVQPKGIYCFYSRQLIASLAKLIGDRPCLEIAAGDGTLSRFLRDAGVEVTATDDYSWSAHVTFPDEVQHLDARKALRLHRPRVVICSWPPAGNSFERHVFATDSVELYIVLGTRAEADAGNWEEYRSQTGFTMTRDERMSRQLLPPETSPAAYVFRRSDLPG